MNATPAERYRTLFETMPQGVVYYAADGSVIGVNPAASEIVGMDVAAVPSWPVVPRGDTMREDGTPFPRMPVAGAGQRLFQYVDASGLALRLTGQRRLEKGR